jgi:serine protease AprX
MEGFTDRYRKRGTNLVAPHSYPAVWLLAGLSTAAHGELWVEGVSAMRQHRTMRGGVRANALWGQRGDNRKNALWGSGKRGILMTAIAAMLVVPIAGGAATFSTQKTSAAPAGAATLLDLAAANPDQAFNVIVQTRGGNGKNAAAEAIDAARSKHPGKARGLKKEFSVISGGAAELTGAQIVDLASRKNVIAITQDVPMVASSNPNTSTSSCAACPFEGVSWPYITGVTGFWQKPGAKAAPAPQAPAIAVVDSGVDAGNPMFGGRVVKQVALTSLTPNANGDGRGHGTFVAGLAAGMLGTTWGGASPTSKIVSLDVMNDNGKAMTSDVIAAADWIYQNKNEYGIRVANFSLHAEGESSFLLDPLDRAVERLWFSGVVVVAAAGNYASDGQPSGVLYAPANDPFVITVGSVDVNGTTDLADDLTSPWSSYGYTLDGFSKPELAAPGRYMLGAVPTTSTMPAERPDRVVAPGFMWMSGTSFAAPVVAGAAADLFALHPNWTPNQVKGALMVSAKALPAASAGSAGVGELKLDAAALVTAPPDANVALDRFLTPDPLGGSTPVFDAASWAEAARADTSWDTASWADASWAQASWSDASWAAASWSDASWATASWADASWPEASWADGETGKHAWADLSWLN